MSNLLFYSSPADAWNIFTLRHIVHSILYAGDHVVSGAQIMVDGMKHSINMCVI